MMFPPAGAAVNAPACDSEATKPSTAAGAEAATRSAPPLYFPPTWPRQHLLAGVQALARDRTEDLLDWSQEKLAEGSGLSGQTVIDFELQRRVVAPESIDKMKWRTCEGRRRGTRRPAARGDTD